MSTFNFQRAARGALASLLLVIGPATAAADEVRRADPSTYAVETVASGFERPWAIALLPDDRTRVSERAGRLRSVAPDGAVGEIALDGLPSIYDRGANELMDVILDPRFAENGLLYLSLTYGDFAATGTVVVRARLAGDRLDDVRIVFKAMPKHGTAHNGGRMTFLPDETIVLALGDGQTPREEAQNIASHLGKLVRFDRDGQIPTDNPFVSRPGAAPGLFSLGHRNVQGLAVDPASGSLLSTEHGPRGGDEINLIRPGANYGWPLVTDGLDYSFARVTPFQRLPGYEDPLLDWTPSIAPSGLAIYDGEMFSHWRGDLLVPALKEKTLRRVIRKGEQIVDQELLLAERTQRIRDVKVGRDGSIYVLTDGPDAELLRIVAPRNRAK